MMPRIAHRHAGEALVQPLDASEIQDAWRQHNPDLATSEISSLSQVTELLLGFVAELPSAELREIAQDKDQFTAALEQALLAVSRSLAGQAVEEDEHSPGSGLGTLQSLKDGRAALARYATAKPLEEWAGPVAGAGGVEKQLGIVRSTLSDWYQKGAVVGLLRGQRKLAYPLEQFVDARPLEGVADVLRLAPDARSAWLWMKQPHGALDGDTPLERLRAGQRQKVSQVAGRDFHNENV